MPLSYGYPAASSVAFLKATSTSVIEREASTRRYAATRHAGQLRVGCFTPKDAPERCPSPSRQVAFEPAARPTQVVGSGREGLKKGTTVGCRNEEYECDFELCCVIWLRSGLLLATIQVS